jgi:hypothetical protein
MPSKDLRQRCALALVLVSLLLGLVVFLGRSLGHLLLDSDAAHRPVGAAADHDAVYAHAATSVLPDIELAPGVRMPQLSLGGVRSQQSAYSTWLALGGRGVDTAMVYGDEVNSRVGSAIRASGLPRAKIFVTSKLPPCCMDPSARMSWRCTACRWFDYSPSWCWPCGMQRHMCNWLEPDGTRPRAHVIDAHLRMLGVQSVDLMLLHWPCDAPAATIRSYHALEELQLSGHARTIGLSNANASLLEALLPSALRVRPVATSTARTVPALPHSARVHCVWCIT